MTLYRQSPRWMPLPLPRQKRSNIGYSFEGGYCSIRNWFSKRWNSGLGGEAVASGNSSNPNLLILRTLQCKVPTASVDLGASPPLRMNDFLSPDGFAFKCKSFIL